MALTRAEDIREVKEEEPQFIIPQPKGELIGQCVFCQLAIGSKDKTREIGGNIVHKRCFKKARKLMFQGLSQEEIVKRLQR